MRNAGSRNELFVTSGVVKVASDEIVGCAALPRVLSHLSPVHFFDKKSPLRLCIRWISGYVKSMRGLQNQIYGHVVEV